MRVVTGHRTAPKIQSFSLRARAPLNASHQRSCRKLNWPLLPRFDFLDFILTDHHPSCCYQYFMYFERSFICHMSNRMLHNDRKSRHRRTSRHKPQGNWQFVCHVRNMHITKVNHKLGLQRCMSTLEYMKTALLFEANSSSKNRYRKATNAFHWQFGWNHFACVCVCVCSALFAVLCTQLRQTYAIGAHVCVLREVRAVCSGVQRDIGLPDVWWYNTINRHKY